MTTFTLITGASAGIGLGIVKQLAAKKHHLILVVRNQEPLKRT